MLKIKEHLDKENLHHAYLIEGNKDLILPEILDFLKQIKIAVANNPDFCQISIDNFKIDDAFSLKAMSAEKNITFAKKIFIISANNFLLQAQNTLLKMLEEPIEDTHFFFIVPDINVLLPTFVSRFYLIRSEKEQIDELKEAEKFVLLSKKDRIDFLKELLLEPEEEEVGTDSARSRASNFLNSLESILHSKIFKAKTKELQDTSFFDQIFKVREYLRQPGSSTKSLMESVALSVPIF